LNSASFVQDRELKPRLDIRGMRGDEALSAVDKFLDDATLTPLRTIIIIHGIGTGTLRKVVSEMLKGDPRVKAYRPADWNQGGAGATIVDLN
jgi:DNA mismatch repair protein MutS2